MSKELTKWRCRACGEDDNFDMACYLETDVVEPEFCPISGEECDWYEVKK